MKDSIIYIMLLVFVGLLIYSVFVTPFLVGLTSAYVGDYPSKWRNLRKRYADLWLGFFRFLSPHFRKSLNCTMKEIEKGG